MPSSGDAGYAEYAGTKGISRVSPGLHVGVESTLNLGIDVLFPDAETEADYSEA